MESKNYLMRDKAEENYMRNLSWQRDFAEAGKYCLNKLGVDLYNNGYDCVEFLDDVDLLANEKSSNLYDNLFAKYDKVQKFPSYEIMMKISANINFKKIIADGFKRAQRLDSFNNQKSR